MKRIKFGEEEQEYFHTNSFAERYEVRSSTLKHWCKEKLITPYAIENGKVVHHKSGLRYVFFREPHGSELYQIKESRKNGLSITEIREPGKRRKQIAQLVEKLTENKDENRK